MKQAIYKKNTYLIINEINNILININPKQTNNLINKIISANRIFLVAIGRVNLALQCFGKRLSHLGFKVELNAPHKGYSIKKNESLSDSASKTKTSIQPMSTLFDQALHIYGDIVSIQIIEKLRLKKNKLWQFHANLE